MRYQMSIIRKTVLVQCQCSAVLRACLVSVLSAGFGRHHSPPLFTVLFFGGFSGDEQWCAVVCCGGVGWGVGWLSLHLPFFFPCD